VLDSDRLALKCVMAIRLPQIARALDPKYVKVREPFVSVHSAAPCMMVDTACRGVTAHAAGAV